MKNKLIKANSLWYKIKKYIFSIFHKSKQSKEQLISTDNEKRLNKVFLEHPKGVYDKNILDTARKLCCNEIKITELTESELDVMIEYFRRDISKKEKEFNQIKQRILRIKNTM